jgi:hypothetical protein
MGVGDGRRNGPNNVCTCEYMNKKFFKNFLKKRSESVA